MVDKYENLQDSAATIESLKMDLAALRKERDEVRAENGVLRSTTKAWLDFCNGLVIEIPLGKAVTGRKLITALNDLIYKSTTDSSAKLKADIRREVLEEAAAEAGKERVMFLTHSELTSEGPDMERTRKIRKQMRNEIVDALKRMAQEPK